MYLLTFAHYQSLCCPFALQPHPFASLPPLLMHVWPYLHHTTTHLRTPFLRSRKILLPPTTLPSSVEPSLPKFPYSKCLYHWHLQIGCPCWWKSGPKVDSDTTAPWTALPSSEGDTAEGSPSKTDRNNLPGTPPLATLHYLLLSLLLLLLLLLLDFAIEKRNLDRKNRELVGAFGALFSLMCVCSITRKPLFIGGSGGAQLPQLHIFHP
jgi:hypothetical protein